MDTVVKVTIRKREKDRAGRLIEAVGVLHLARAVREITSEQDEPLSKDEINRLLMSVEEAANKSGEVRLWIEESR